MDTDDGGFSLPAMYTIEPIPEAAHWGGRMCYISPTPALSLGERENGPLSLGHTRGGVCQASMCKPSAWRWMFPSPRERVRVRGNESSTGIECRISNGFLCESRIIHHESTGH